MPVKLVCVGRLRERWCNEAAAEYLKRLERLMPVKVMEVRDEPEAEGEALERALRAREGERILKCLSPGDYVIALCVDGQPLTSPALARKLDGLFCRGQSQVAFVVGGSLGLGDNVLARAHERMSMSAMTFPHPLARVMLLEQLFRAAKINAGERYHK